MNRPNPADVALVTQPLPVIQPTNVPEGKWEKCECGKVLTASEEDAHRRADAAADRYNRHVPLRFYTCKYGVWHWAERYITVRDCDCGHPSYYDARAASKAAERRNRRPRSEDITARAYVCAHGGNHVLLYPVGEHVTQCECGAITYRTVAVAARLLAYLQEHHPKDGNPYSLYLCDEKNRVHLAREDDFPPGAKPAVEL